jgi:hypothetical protein
MHVLSIGDWNVHLGVDWNTWLVGASWHVDEDDGDIGIYLGPVNAQIERYDRGILPEPKPEDAVDDPWPDLRRSTTEPQGDAPEPARFADISNLVVVERERTGVPMDVYIARILIGIPVIPASISRRAIAQSMFGPTCNRLRSHQRSALSEASSDHRPIFGSSPNGSSSIDQHCYDTGTSRSAPMRLAQPHIAGGCPLPRTHATSPGGW